MEIPVVRHVSIEFDEFEGGGCSVAIDGVRSVVSMDSVRGLISRALGFHAADITTDDQVVDAMRKTNNNVSAAAGMLGVSRPTVRSRLARLGLVPSSGSGGGSRARFDSERILSAYAESGSVRDAARVLGCSLGVIYRHLHLAGINPRNKSTKP